MTTAANLVSLTAVSCWCVQHMPCLLQVVVHIAGATIEHAEYKEYFGMMVSFGLDPLGCSQLATSVRRSV